MDENNVDRAESQVASDSGATRPIRCIVKLGGAAITCKNELEKINEENLKVVSSQLRQAMGRASFSQKVVGFDWSKRPGVSDVSCSVSDIINQDQLDFDLSRFVVVHGAGSFGHFQASKSGVHKGGLDQPLVKAGFVATQGIPSVGMSPFSCGWLTSNRNVISADLLPVTNAINSGFIPVLHGDAVVDNQLGCTILSGDVIIRHIAGHLKPEYVVFLTDVLGVYDRPPADPNAILLREIAVDEAGNWSVVKPLPQNMKQQVEITVASHDTTGGMVTKISEAALIAKLGIDVFIVKAATSHSRKALSGEIRNNIPEDWLGTVIRFSG